MEKTSVLPGFYKLPIEERLRIIKEFSGLSNEDVASLQKAGSLDMKKADMMLENVIGTIQLPLGIAANFLINGKDYLIPMALEEPSVIAAASNAAKLARPEGFVTSSTDPLMIGQIQLVGIKDTEKAEQAILSKKDEAISIANRPDSTMVKLGGGLKDIEVRILDGMVIIHLIVDVRDAMGANAINTIAEKLAPLFEAATGGEARLRILSNLAEKRLTRARAVWKKESLEKSMKSSGISGEDVVDAIVDAYQFAVADQYRATTNNKGVMNGIDAVCVATGNDFRALEAGAHSFASLNKSYQPFAHFSKDNEGNLVGEIELPLAVGIVGGSTKTNPIPRIALKILGVTSAQELAEVMAAVGLANNFAALRVLATEGIQRGHMRLHAKNLAIQAGASEEEVQLVAQQLTFQGEVTASAASRVLGEIREKK